MPQSDEDQSDEILQQEPERTWTREEVRELVEVAFVAGYANTSLRAHNLLKVRDEWVKNNL